MTAAGRVLVARYGKDKGLRKLRVLAPSLARNGTAGYRVECVAHPRLPHRVGSRSVMAEKELRHGWEPAEEDDRGSHG